MNTHPVMLAVNARADANVTVFDTPEAFFDALLGPAQHDSHVSRFRQHRVFAASQAHADSFDALVKAKLAQYGSYSAWLKAEPAHGAP